MSENIKIQDSAYGAENSVNETTSPCQTCDVQCEDTGKKVLDAFQGVSVVEQEPSIKDKIKGLLSHRLINRIAVLVLAVVLLALAFAPIIYCEVELDGATQAVKLSGLDALKMTGVMSSPKVFDPEDMADNFEFYRAERFKQLVTSRSAFSKVGLSASTVTAVVAYLLYTVLVAVVLIIAAWNLISEYLIIKKKKMERKKYASDKLFPLLLCIFPAVYFCLAKATDLYISNIFSGSAVCFAEPKMAGGIIASLILLVLGSIFTCATYSLDDAHVNVRYFNRERVKHLVCIGLVIVAILCSLGPCVQIKTWEPSRDKETIFDVSLWDIRQMTKQDRDAYRKATSKISLEYIDEVKEQDNASEILMNSILMRSSSSTIRAIYLAIQIVFSIMLFLLGLLLWSLLGRAFFGAKRLRAVNLLKTLTMICACVCLGVVITLQVLLGACLSSGMKVFVDFALGGGMIMSFVCILLAVVLRLKKRSHDEYVDDEYDNADVSYAPYVLYIKD